MNIDRPENVNYSATVVRVKTLVPLENCDNVVSAPFFGMSAIVSKDVQVGDLGVVFTAETQLSHDFCRFNNLYRHGHLNEDPTKTGYIEDNRRIRAQKFRGNLSNALFMGLESLAWAANVSDLKEGDVFDTLNGNEICRKYVVKTREPRLAGKQEKKFSRVDAIHLPEHYDTENFFRNRENIDPEQEVIVTQKLHGTSIRVGYTFVKRKRSIVERVAALLGAKIQSLEHDYVFGSRKVIKDANNPDQNHYYDTDIWSHEGRRLEGLLPKGFLVYGELVGWTPENKPIQENYIYGVPLGMAELYVYRIAHVNEDGHVVDLPWDHVVEFCKTNGIKSVPELWRGKLKDFDVDSFMNRRYFEDGYLNAIALGENKEIVDEGVCVRVDTIRPYILKAKCAKFLEHETKILDRGEEDLEASQS